MTNYVRHLNAFFSIVRSDKRLACSHVSLYMALFQYWNFNRFQNPFPVYRENIMQLSCMGSKTTYHKCLRELNSAGYIRTHPSTSKFQPLRITVIRLDNYADASSCNQLPLFHGHSSLPNDKKQGAKIDTEAVRQPAAAGTGFGTVTVPESVHPFKPNGKQQNCVSNTPTKVFNKNRQLSSQVNALAGVPISSCEEPMPRANGEKSSPKEKLPFLGGAPPYNEVLPPLRGVTPQYGELTPPSGGILPHYGELSPPLGGEVQGRPGRSERPAEPMRPKKIQPVMTEVEIFFKTNNYPAIEAHKFFLYNQGKHWMLTDKIPIYDWQALAHKWMLNAGTRNKKEVTDIAVAIQYTYERFLEGISVSRLIQPEYCDELKLCVSEEVKAEAVQRRMNQLAGSNEGREIKLRTAYSGGIAADEVVVADAPVLLALAKRVAVLRHFHALRAAGQKQVFLTAPALAK